MSVEPSAKPFVVVGFQDLVLNVEAVHFLEVVEDQAGEKACTACADDADFVLASLDLARWHLVMVRGACDGYELVALLDSHILFWIRLLDALAPRKLPRAGRGLTKAGIPFWISKSCSRMAILAQRALHERSSGFRWAKLVSVAVAILYGELIKPAYGARICSC